MTRLGQAPREAAPQRVVIIRNQNATHRPLLTHPIPALG
jgi:hypothetical protein